MNRQILHEFSVTGSSALSLNLVKQVQYSSYVLGFLDRQGVDLKEGDCQVICGRVRS